MNFKRPNPIFFKKDKPLFQPTKDFSNLTYKDDSKYKPIIAVKAKDSNPRIILQTMTDYYKEIVDFLVAIGEPIVRTKNFHEYELTKFSLYSASSMGVETSDIIQILENISKNALQKDLKDFIIENTKTYGMARLLLKKKRYFISCKNQEVFNIIKEIQEVKISNQKVIYQENKPMELDDNNPEDVIPPNCIEISSKDFGSVRSACEREKYPLLEEYAFKEDEGNILNITPKFKSPVRPYQEKALNIMCSNGIARSGIIVLPCGAGKTLVGILAICTIKRNTIIICNNNVAVKQWYREINDWVNITVKDKLNEKEDKNRFICRFTSNQKDPLWNFKKEAGILITSFTMLSFTGKRSAEVEKALEQLREVDWGLMVIDEVQLLPAKTFSEIIKEKYKSHCKLGLTATLVREDEGIKDLHLLIGPKLYEANWLDLQKDGFLARVKCIEIWSEMHPDFYKDYLEIKDYDYQKLLYVSNPNKYLVTLYLLQKHEGDKIIIFSDNLFTIKQYNEFFLKKNINFKMIHGKISNKQRENILSEFRSESGMNILLMTKVGDISIDIPNANVIIQVSSHFGSRMQEAQRFGRILRAKKDILSEYNAFFYTIVSKNTEEMKYSTKRHRFLVDQGYYFTIMNDKKIIEESIQDSNYKEYVKDTLDKINIKYNHKEKIEEDFSDSKDSFAILNELEKERDDTTISTNIF
jgi:DNA excision repair protein ERCC-3